MQQTLEESNNEYIKLSEKEIELMKKEGAIMEELLILSKSRATSTGDRLGNIRAERDILKHLLELRGKQRELESYKNKINGI